MNIWWLIGLIVLILGVIVGNLLLLKLSAKAKMKSPPGDASKASKPSGNNANWDEKDDW